MGVQEQVRDWGMLAAVGLGLYMVWRYVFERPGPGTEPCDGMMGLPRLLCDLGVWTTGYTSPGDGGPPPGGPEPPPWVEPARDAYGCIIEYGQHWCESLARCLDIAQACPPVEGCPPGTEWSPLYGQCLSLPPPPVTPSEPPVGGCPPNHFWSVIDQRCLEYLTPPQEERTKSCPDGSYVYPSQECPPWIPPISDTVGCVCNGIVYEVPRTDIPLYGSCGNYCDVVHPAPSVPLPPSPAPPPPADPCFGGAILWQCPSGWIDRGVVPGYGDYHCCVPR